MISVTLCKPYNIPVIVIDWRVIQRRVDPEYNFFRTWESYENGFGTEDSDYWIGLLELHRLTSSCTARLHISMDARDGSSAYADYNEFSVGDAESEYELTAAHYSGDAGDELSSLSGTAFRTYDRDWGGCAADRQSGWWFHSSCTSSNPNGRLNVGMSWAGDKRCAYWYGFKEYRAMRYIEIYMYV